MVLRRSFDHEPIATGPDDDDNTFTFTTHTGHEIHEGPITAGRVGYTSGSALGGPTVSRSGSTDFWII